MDTTPDPRPGPADAPATILFSHPAFCQLGLPVRAGKGPWTRDVGTACVTITAGPTEAALPGGKLLRALLLLIMDGAVRGGAPVVDLEPDAASVAARFGLDATPAKLRDLIEQLDRLVSAKITVSTDSGPALSLFDGRARTHVDEHGWRASVKLNAKFFASLVEKPIPLEAAVVAALIGQPATLDVYMAVAFATADLEPAQSAATTWDDLLTRFGTNGQDLETFRPQVEESLRTISGLCPLFSLIVADRGVDVRKLPPRPVVVRAPKSAPVPPPAPAPIAAELPRIEPLREVARPEPVRAEPVRAEAPRVEPPRVEPPRPVAPMPQPVPEPVYERQQEGYGRGGRGPAQTIALRSNLTGLQQVIWLQRANGRDDPLVEITPGNRYDPATVTVLALEPVVVQIVGGLHQREFERVSAWTMANRDLIDAFWYEEIDDQDEILAQVKKVPAPGWRE